jgi:hypothetical protein
VYPNWDDPLLPLMTAYHAAVVRSDGLRSKLTRQAGDTDLLDRSLAAAEQVIQTRAALHRGLIDLGWTPPKAVADNLHFDDAVLRLPGAT